MVTVRFMALTGAFKETKREDFADLGAATKAVTEYATAAGFVNVKKVDDEEDFGVRWTAKTPGGRAGRNVAFGDVGFGFDGEVVA